ncbi:AtuA-related protein [Rummeliibacillus sp. JY-2-4R]
MKLKEIAHSRSGDKGNISNISVIVYSMKDYEMVKEIVTAIRVKEYFGEIVKGDVQRYELPNIGALNFVMQQALGGGVTRSLSIDRHGKTLSSALLDMEIDLEPKLK